MLRDGRVWATIVVVLGAFGKTLAKDSELETRDFITKQQEILRSHGIDSVF